MHHSLTDRHTHTQMEAEVEVEEGVPGARVCSLLRCTVRGLAVQETWLATVQGCVARGYRVSHGDWAGRAPTPHATP